MVAARDPSTFLHGGLLHIGFNMFYRSLGPALKRFRPARLPRYLRIRWRGRRISPTRSFGGAVVGASGSLMALIGALAGYGKVAVWNLEESC